MFDPQQSMNQAPPMGAPTSQSPGGDPGKDGDPLKDYFEVASGFLGQFANAAKMVDPELANEIDQMKTKLIQKQLKRQRLISVAASKVGAAIGMQ